jgi:rhamnosyl/mannosyltransferase
MYILHLYKDYFPVMGGIENHIRVLAESQVSAGHSVTVLACNTGSRTCTDYMNGVKIIKSGRIATMLSMPLSLSQPISLSRMKPDIVHVHSPYPLGEISNWLLNRARATVMTYHSDIVRQKSWLYIYGPFLRRVLASVDRIITSSHQYIQSSPWLKPLHYKCAVIPLGVDTYRFTPPYNDAQAGLPKECIQTVLCKDSFKILFVGRLRYYKGLDTLLQSLTLLPEAQLTLVGEGPMRRTWEALSQKLGLTERVIFRGEVDDAALPDYYKQADLFVLPASVRAEAFGTVLLEAMASGLPCITTELDTGTSWVVEDGVTGIIVPPDDPEALTQAVRTLMQDPSLRSAMGRAGRKRAEQFFSDKKMTQKVEALYHELLE